MVSYSDGSVLAELGNPDMRTPIAHALSWPERINAGVTALDLTKQGQLDFFEPDLSRFKCLKMAFQALEKGGTAATVLNAANEISVAAFLKGELSFTGITDTIQQTIDSVSTESITNLDTVLNADAKARKVAEKIITSINTMGTR
jgi:1-deoxy-D-xylulose-5-phosphate reductoisomerase